MSTKSTTTTDASGVIFIEERDGATNVLLRRMRAGDDQQSTKARRRLELRERIHEWALFKSFVDEAALPAHSEAAGAITTGRTQQEALYQAARAAYIDWLNAP